MCKSADSYTLLTSRRLPYTLKIRGRWISWRIKDFYFDTLRANGTGDVFAASCWRNQAASMHSCDYPPPPSTPPEYKKGASQYHRAERRLQFFNISLASWVLPQPESDQCHSLWDIAHYTGGAQRLLDLWGNIGEDRAPVWKKKSPLGLPRWVYQRAWRLIRQTRLRQIKRDREGLSSERR